MTSPGHLGDFRPGPLYFFDQPTKQDQTTRSRILTHVHFDLLNEGARLAATTKSKLDTDKHANNDAHKEVKSDENTLTVPNGVSVKPISTTAQMCDKTVEDALVDVSEDINPVDAYKRAAPLLLTELAELILLYQESEDDGCFPHGLVNVLNYTWRDLTAGAVYVRRSWSLVPCEVAKPRKSKVSMNFEETVPQIDENAKKKIKRKASMSEKNTSLRNIQDPTVRKNTFVSKANKAHLPTTISFSVSSEICKEQGWLVRPKEALWDEPLWTTLCKWAVERLQLAMMSIKAQAAKQAEQGLNKQLVLRHYGKDKPPHMNRKVGGRVQPVPSLTLCNGLPQVPELQQNDPTLQKLHYRINDGSSFIYYPSGHVAVCQSHSGLPSGGFYTNVFTDAACPIILASITAFGHGTVTHHPSGTIMAVWDQNGGLTCDPDGSVTQEWTWQTGPGPKEKIVIQVLDQICVRLSSGTSATLCFKMQKECVKLPLSALSTSPKKETSCAQHACLQTEEQLTSLKAQELSLARTTRRSQNDNKERRRAPTLKSVDGEGEPQEEPSPSRRGGWEDRKLGRLQRRVKNILDDWLEFYRSATGIRCPDIERMSDGPQCLRVKRQGPSAAQSTPHAADSSTEQPEGSSVEHVSRNVTAHGDVPLGSSPKLARMPNPKKVREEHHHIALTGTLRVHSNIRLDSGEIHPPSQLHLPTPSPSSSCPAQLRAASQGEGGRKLCRCSSRLMPVLSDLEYDAFISGQPPHSEQILVVCVTVQRQAPATAAVHDALEQLYETMNKNRIMPCTQCQLDSFRLVRYEMSTGTSSAGPSSTSLLQHRHNAAPGMFLMYIRGKLLFADYIFNGYSCSVRDLHKQIAKTRADYRRGRSLPSDYRFSARLKSPVNGHLPLPSSQEPHMNPFGGESEEALTIERITTQGLVTSLTLKTLSVPKAKKTAASLPGLTH